MAWKKEIGKIITRMGTLQPKEIILKARRPGYGGIMMKTEILKRKRTSVNTNLYKRNRNDKIDEP